MDYACRRTRCTECLAQRNAIAGTRSSLQQGDVARVRQYEQRVCLFRTAGGPARQCGSWMVVDVVVRRRLQLPWRIVAAGGAAPPFSNELRSARATRGG